MLQCVYCRALRTGDAPSVVGVAQNVARLICCCSVVAAAAAAAAAAAGVVVVVAVVAVVVALLKTCFPFFVSPCFARVGGCSGPSGHDFLGDFRVETSSSTDGFSREDVQQNFPLAAVCINITKMVMDALVANQLSSLEGCVPPGMSCEGLGGLQR